MVNVLDFIKDIGEIIAENTEQHLVLKRIVSHLAEQINSDVCTIYVYNENDKKLVMAAAYGYPDSAIGNVSLEPGDGVTGAAFSTRRPINTDEPSAHNRYRYFPELHEDQNHSILSMPLKVAEKTVGVLNLESTRKQKFPNNVVELIRAISPQIANVLLDCQMFNKLNVPAHKSTDRVNDKRLNGEAVTEGLVIGRALIMDTDSLLNSINWQPVHDIEGELALFDEALEYAKQETIRLEKEASKVLTESDASIFYSHLLILDDKHLLDSVRNFIKEGTIVKFALKNTLIQLKKQFAQIDSGSIRERLADITDVILRVVHSVNYILQGKKIHEDETCPFDIKHDKLIIIAHELYPSQLISWPLHKMAGIICETGGATSHVAIISKALKIPTLMGVKNATKLIRQSELLLLDCHAENCYVNPSEDLLSKFSAGLKACEKKNSHHVGTQSPFQTTADGVSVDLLANMSLVSELPMMEMYGANGIGLYRTEFLYMVRTSHPSVPDQVAVYTRFAEACKGKPFTLRLLDVGGDKPVSYLKFVEETNPLLGVRGLRLLLKNQRLLRLHIEAILLTTLTAPVKILIPMVTTIDELLEVKKIINEIKVHLEAKHNTVINNYKLGIMVETPSIVWELEKVLKHVDFVSIGSNDLIQYSFAIDRNNSVAIDKFKSLNPATIRILKHIVDTVRKHPEKTITLCGEIAANPLATPLLLGIGLTSFSMSPWVIPEIRAVIKTVTIEKCREFAHKYIQMDTLREAELLMEEFKVHQALVEL